MRRLLNGLNETFRLERPGDNVGAIIAAAAIAVAVAVTPFLPLILTPRAP